MDAYKRYLLRCMIILILAGITTSCSGIGMAAGSTGDKENEKIREIQGWQLTQIDEGMIIDITLKDGTNYRGQFQGMKSTAVNKPDTVPGQLVEQNNKSDIYREIGDSILVHMIDGRSLWFRFEGCAQNAVLIRNPATNKKGSIRFARISSIMDTEKTKIPIEALLVLADKTGNLYADHISLLENGKFHFIDPDSVSTVTIYESDSNNVSQGFVAGILVVAVVVVAITSIKESIP